MTWLRPPAAGSGPRSRGAARSRRPPGAARGRSSRRLGGRVRASAPRRRGITPGHAHAGSLGAVAFTRAKVLVDSALAERTNMVTGANQDGFHLRGVDVRRDLLAHGTPAELRTVQAGEGCPR